MSTRLARQPLLAPKRPKGHWEIKGRFRKRVVLANVLVPVFVPGEHPPKPPFWKPPFCQHQKGSLGDKRAVSKRVVLANVPSFRFSFRGNIRQNHPFGNHPFANPRKIEKKQFRFKFSISPEKCSLAWNFQSWPPAFPTNKSGFGGRLAWNFQASLKLSSPEGDLELFHSIFVPLGTRSFPSAVCASVWQNVVRTIHGSERHLNAARHLSGTRQKILGGRFEYFLFFSARGRGRGSPRCQEGAGVSFYWKYQGGGGFSHEGGGGGEGPGGCLRGILGGAA